MKVIPVLLLEITLRISNHAGFTKTEQVEVRSPKAIYYNGVLVQDVSSARLKKALATLTSLPQPGSRSCASGRYSYTVNDGSRVQTAHGCSEGPEFARKFVAFQEFKKQVVAK